MKPAWVALVCVVAAVVWWSFTVQCNYGGNITGLFTHGAQKPIPPGLAHENIHLFANAPGFDGQFFHYMAHDPLIQTDFQKYMDTTRLRYRRIFVPGLAHLLALGRDSWLHASYVFVMALFLYGGVFAVATYAVQAGFSPWLGCAFLLIPATVISIDRMAVDMPAAACIAAYVVLARMGSRWPLYVLLMAAPLVRETGSLLIGSHVLLMCVQRKFSDAALFATAILPAFGWGAYVAARTPPYNVPIVPMPFATIVQVLASESRGVPPWPTILKALHVTAIGGAWLGLILGIKTALHSFKDPLQLPLFGYSGIALMVLNGERWFGVYDFDRLCSPLLLLLLLSAIRERRWWLALPMLMVVPRTAIEAAWQWRGVQHCFTQ